MGKHRNPRTKSDPDVRFASRVSRVGTCWVWQGSVHKTGYGRFWDGERHVYAHRFAYERYIGPIPDGLQIDHLCHGWDRKCRDGDDCAHRRCVNPEHLEAVTPRVNVLRGNTPAATSAARTECPAGHPYSESNTVIRADGFRRCRTCLRDGDRRRYWRKAAS